jgi:glycosyltransferase involved in cell wall biosynthesis
MRLGINGRFYRAPVTGVQRFAREVTDRLCDLADVTLLLPRGVEPPHELRARTVGGRLTGHAWEQLELPARARAAGCNVTLHLSGTAPVHGGPHVVVIHDVLPLTHPHWFSRRFARWYATVLPPAVRNAAAVLTVSAWSRDEIVRVLGRPSGLAIVTQGITPFDGPASDTEVGAVRTRFGLPDRWLLAVGRSDPRKNHAFLADVLAELRRRGRAIPLVIVGDAAPRVHGRRPGIDGADVFTPGHVTDHELRSLYTGAIALCFPSLAEGFGRPPLEAAACGTPSLVADLPAIAPDGRTAGLALPLDPAAWADAITRLEQDADLRARTVQRVRGEAFDMSWDACAAQVLDACTAAARDARYAAMTTLDGDASADHDQPVRKTSVRTAGD